MIAEFSSMLTEVESEVTVLEVLHIFPRVADALGEAIRYKLMTVVERRGINTLGKIYKTS